MMVVATIMHNDGVMLERGGLFVSCGGMRSASHVWKNSDVWALHLEYALQLVLNSFCQKIAACTRRILMTMQK